MLHASRTVSLRSCEDQRAFVHESVFDLFNLRRFYQHRSPLSLAIKSRRYLIGIICFIFCFESRYSRQVDVRSNSAWRKTRYSISIKERFSRIDYLPVNNDLLLPVVEISNWSSATQYYRTPQRATWDRWSNAVDWSLSYYFFWNDLYLRFLKLVNKSEA